MEQARARGRSAFGSSPAGFERALDVLLDCAIIVALVLINRASLIGIKGGIGEFLASLRQQAERVVKLEVVPKHGGGFEIPVRISRFDLGDAVPKRARLRKAFPIRVDLAGLGQRRAVAGSVLYDVLDQSYRFRRVLRPIRRQRAIDRRGAQDDRSIAGILRGQRVEDRCGFFEMRFPGRHLGNQLRSPGVGGG